MSFFSYKSKNFFVESVPVREILKKVGTPTYIYSLGAMKENFRAYASAFADLPHLICYSMKCNSNLAVLKSFIKMGSGIDIVSQGELFRAIMAGASAKKIVFSGVGKTEAEIAYALRKKILMFNVESEQELEILNTVARKLRTKAPVAIRINPNINPKTHPYITTGMKKSKFGIQYDKALSVYRRAKNLPGLEIIGIDCHIGSQLTQVGPFVDALKRVLALLPQLKALGINIRYLDLGGGLGIRYKNENPPNPSQYARALKTLVKSQTLTLILEPGRSLMGNAGILASQVLYTKERDNKRFLIVDAGMNDLIRPAFYDSYHEILPLVKTPGKKQKVDVVGPVCESGDFLAQNRMLPRYARGDFMAVMSAGAYGFTMASNYNTRPRSAEVLVMGKRFYVIRTRETYSDLLRGEVIPKPLK